MAFTRRCISAFERCKSLGFRTPLLAQSPQRRPPSTFSLLAAGMSLTTTLNACQASSSEKVASMEERVQRDEGGRGIKGFCITGELMAASKALAEAKSVLILTGFPCNMDFEQPQETDGPPGAVAIARACVQFGKQVTIATDDCNFGVVKAAVGDDNRDIEVVCFPPGGAWGKREVERAHRIAERTDHIVAIEITPSSSTCWLASAFPAKGILEEARRRNVSSTGIGDGGNELGMGKVIASGVPNAEVIACTVATDHLITCSVSNWGGYALAGALGVTLRSKAASLPSDREETELLERIRQVCTFLYFASFSWDGVVNGTDDTVRVACLLYMRFCSLSAGARDGVSGELGLSVDGMPLSVQLSVLRDLREIAEGSLE
eukprot:jgi/Bigna1/88483/estExt_fgenesh1_pg.C_320151